MSDVRYLSKKYVKEFIDLYRSLPSLWNSKSKDYYNRPKKNAAYDILVNKLRELEPEATRDTVTQKINSLRSSRRKETVKVRQALEAGAEPYVPKLWYYQMMGFLDDQPTRKKGGSGSQEERDEKDDSDSENASSPQSPDNNEISSVTVVSPRQLPVSFSDEDNKMPPVVAFTTEPTPKQPNRKRKLNQDETKTEQHEAFGRYIALKLENLQSKQRIYVEKIINDAIFEAELGNLNRHCSVHVPAVSDSE